MQDRNRSYLDRFGRIRRGDQDSLRQEQIVVTRIPIQTTGESYLASSPRQDAYQQALRVLLETPQMERRLNYMTTSMIATILERWLADSAAKSRASTTFAGILLILCGTALVGLLVGIVLGEGLIPKESLPVLLVVTIGILIFVLAVMLGGLLLQSTQVD